MGRKRTPGLFKRGESWHIDKQVFGQRIRESTGSNTLEEAEKHLAKRIESLRQVVVYGTRPKRIFMEAATKFLRENQHKKSIQSDAEQLEMLDRYIGDLPIETVHIGNLQPFITARKRVGLTVRVHDLKHTFGRRLRAAGVSFEDRQDLLGHKSGRITTHYSAAEIGSLIAAANKICETRQYVASPTLTLLRCVNAG